MHAIRSNGKMGHEFEGDWRGVYGTVWREERIRKNGTISKSQK